MATPVIHPPQRHDLPLGYPVYANTNTSARLSNNRSLHHQPQSIGIRLGTLKNFEIVTDQYQKDGLLFENAIAIHPSNPAFPIRSEQILLVGGPKVGVIDMLFLTPVYAVEAHVTGSMSTVLTSFDAYGNVISRSETLGSNLSGREHTHHPANTRLAIGDQPTSPMDCIGPSTSWPSPPIHRVQFRSHGGQFTMTDISILK